MGFDFETSLSDGGSSLSKDLSTDLSKNYSDDGFDVLNGGGAIDFDF